MAIVKMKKLHVIAMADRREALLKGLLHLGCVEISQPEEVLSDPEWAALFRRSETLLTQRKAELTDVDTARLRIADDLDGIARAAQTAASMFRSLGRRRTKRSSGP